MGQQQLVLIVLSIIVVAIAAAAGINYFNNNIVQFNRDAVIEDLHNLTTDTRTYYKKAKSQGGGGNNSLSYSMPTPPAQNDNGTFSAISVTPQRVIFREVAVENVEQGMGCTGGHLKITYTMTVYPDSASLRKIF
jgi:hypothetical protein